MAHTGTSFMSVVTVRRVGVAARALGFVVCGVLASGSSCLDLLLDEEPCQAACDFVEFCDFQSLAACEAAMCDESGEVKASVRDLDDCLKGTDDCLEAAACPCDGGCERIEECGGDPDPTCVETCDTLVDQESKAAFLENACRIEAESCEDLAVCSSVGG